MTVIAWDRITLATDSMVSSGHNEHLRVPKLFLGKQHATDYSPEGEEAILAGSGQLKDIDRLKFWWEQGGWSQSNRLDRQEDEDVYPFPKSDGNTNSQLIAVGENQIVEFNSSDIHSEFRLNPDGLYAWGSGAEVALAVLKSGKDAVSAVKIAIEICNGCGGGIQYCNFKEREIKFLEAKIVYEKVNKIKFDIQI